MAATYLVAGTASHVGKSTVAAGLCRLLADRGVDVAPFKAQNMSNNARAVPRPAAVRGDAAVDRAAPSGDGSGEGGSVRADASAEDGSATPDQRGVADDAFGEIGVSQYVQARAARVRPTTDCNPVLLKPRGDAESQVVVDGAPVAHCGAGEYYDAAWERARAAAEAAHARLAAAHDVVVAEGAGAIAEPNLRDRDLANVETARFADAEVLLVADLERGGAFASVVGTVELLPADLRDRLAGVLLTKFRGDASLLDPAIETVEAEVGVPVLGVVPYDDPGLPAEDSVDLPARDERARRGADDGVPEERAATVAVPRLPRISNFTDLEPLAATPGLRVSYRPLDATYTDADAVVVTGTKNAVDDLLAAREAGLDDKLAAFDGPVVGLCGGYQLLGERIANAAVEGTGDYGAVEGTGEDVVEGLGLLPVETRFEAEKVVRESRLRLDGAGPLAGASGTVSGYEIHAGRTRALGDAGNDLATPFEVAESDDAGRTSEGGADRTGAALGAARGDVLGTYLHGLFENEVARAAFARAAFDAAGANTRPEPAERASPYGRAAALLEDHAELGTVVTELR